MTETAAPPLVARVAVDVSLPHLDRPFDYLVPEAARGVVAPGVRVRVRFAGRLRDGYVLGLSDTSDAEGQLRPLERVISPEVVLTGPVARLCRAVADHYAGTFSDVVRMAVPARHASTEAAQPVGHPAPRVAPLAAVLPLYRGGRGYLDALADGRPLRAAWTPVPVCDGVGAWASGLVEAAGATLSGGRGALLIVPDADALAVLEARCVDAFGAGSFVTLSAELGPAARYRAFLAAARGGVRLVLGTRNAVYAPVRDLGLIALWDEGNDSLAEPRAPYPHAREVAALRAAQERCALLIAGHARTAETQALVERGWLAPLELPPAENRRLGPVVRIAADTDWALDRDPAARAARLPHDVFAAIRAGLASGPVLLQVPRAGYVSALACERCREAARCPRCGRTLRGENAPGARGEPPALRLTCGACGPLNSGGWCCSNCGGVRLRAPRVGVRRTAEEIGKAFPQTRVVESWSGHLVESVSDEPALVLATPGAEPTASGGYAAAILLDTWLLLARPELRAAEEALRRWLAVCALVRPAAHGGTVLAVGETDARALQALVRLDPAGFAARELGDRRATGFPPAAKLVVIEGPRPAVDAYDVVAAAVPGVERFGPARSAAAKGDEEAWRLTLRTANPPPRAQTGDFYPVVGAQPSTLSAGPGQEHSAGGVTGLFAALRAESARRSLAKEPVVRVRVDPQVID